MRIANRWLVQIFGITAVVVLLVAACGSDDTANEPAVSEPAPEQTTTAQPEPDRDVEHRISIVTAFPNNNFYQSMYCGAREAAAELGNIVVDIQGSDTIAAAEELLVFESVVLSEPDGIVLIPYDSQAFIAPVQQQMERGLPIVTADGSLDEPVDILNIRTDNAAGGAILAEEMAKAVPDDAVVGAVTASPTDTVQIQRTEAFIKRFQELKPDATILEIEYAETDANKANAIVSAWILSEPGLAGVFTSAGEQAEGAGAAVSAAGRDDIVVYTYDAFEPTVALLREGVVKGILAQSPYDQGYVSTLNLGKILQGSLEIGDVDPYQRFSALKFIDLSNIDTEEAFPFLQDKPINCPFP